MAGLGGVHEKRRRAGGGKGRGDLAADVAGFAEAGDDQAALGAADQLGCGGKGRTQIGLQGSGERGDAAALGVQRAQRRLHGGVSLRRG